MARMKLDSSEKVKHLLVPGLPAEGARRLPTETACYALLTETMRKTELDWAETGPRQYRPVNVEMHVYVGVEETELNERIEELERAVENLADQQRVFRDALENVLTVSSPLHAGVSREQRRKRLDALFEEAMEAAVEIEERYGDPVELLTTLLPLSEEEARKLERE